MFNCHESVPFDLFGMDFYPDSVANIRHRHQDFDTIINCSGQKFELHSDIPKELQRYVAKSAITAQIITIPWEDFSVPPLEIGFWPKLVEYLLKKNKTNIAICCAAGHGRTGTALASLLVLAGMDPADAIRHIRKIYCDQAVETKWQIEYIASVAGKNSNNIAFSHGHSGGFKKISGNNQKCL